VGPFIRKKVQLGTDNWMQWMPPTPVKEAMSRLAEQVHAVIGDDALDRRYSEACLRQAALCFFTGALMQQTYARLFLGMGEEDLDRMLSSFARRQCVVNRELEGMVRKYTECAAAPA